MPRLRSNGLDLEYDTMGDPAHDALLLINGFSSQLISWEPPFCRLLADAGLYVIRFDNRDVGLSSRIPGDVDLADLLGGTATTVPYGLEDMADDDAGLLDALDIAAAHVVGSSMGGLIAQTLAIKHPERVKSLCSIMSTTGDPTVGQPAPEALTALLSPSATTADEAAARGVRVSRAICSPTYFDEERAARRARAAFERAHHPGGTMRQLAAIATQADRTAALAQVGVPTLVIHGALDPVFHVSGGEATAKAVPGATLVIIDDMAHELPEPLWPRITAEIIANVRRTG